ncbi:Vascular endothelial growth factor receptor 1 [Folsomia candida]|uniref:Vascular endothelial growth factor receptor 1 n=1 Tax=Folsomia candida TaxID=158441 RepID=A0A226EB66_FOLCA|nr:Vascular endothelial growth factor receptor 1 [Folsomia candida]
MTRRTNRYPSWCPVKPCCGIFLQGAIKALAIINVGSNLLLALLLSSRIVAVSPYYWDTANSGNVNTDQITNDQSLLTQTRFVTCTFWGYSYFFMFTNCVYSKFLYNMATKRNRAQLRIWLITTIPSYFIWLTLYCVEAVWLAMSGFYSPVTYLDIYTNMAIWSFIIYKVYAFWIVACFYMELKSCGVLNRALRELSDNEVEEFFKGASTARGGIVLVDEEDDAEAPDSPSSDFTSRPYKPDFEITPDRIVLEENFPLGKGAFGTVLKATLKNKDNPEITDVVAVKTVNSENCDEICFRALLIEVKILSYIGKHENVVNLIGACTGNLKQRNIYVVVEFCPYGCVMNYLRANRGIFIDCVDPIKILEMKNLCPYVSTAGVGGPTVLDLIKWSKQTADGMQFISSRKVIHGDLAARNVLLTANLDVKIADFGLSRQLYKYTTYVKNSDEPLPWRWMALESLVHLNFSTQSDVWAYGVTLWEYFTCGGTPFALETFSQDFVQLLKTGQLTLPQPPYASNEM